MIEVAPPGPGDRVRWTELWTSYLAFYRTQLPPEQFDRTWDRLMDGTLLQGRLARRSGEVVGMVHFLYHPSAWTDAPICYLQDLFTEPAARAAGVARTLINAVADASRARGSTRLYWLTQSDNTVARALYDKIATHNGFIRYDHPL